MITYRTLLCRRKISRIKAKFREMIDNPKKYRFMDMVNLLKNERWVKIVLVDNETKEG